MDTEKLVKHPKDYADGASEKEYCDAVANLMEVARKKLQEESVKTQAPEVAWAGDFGVHKSYLQNEDRDVLFEIVYHGDRYEQAHHLFAVTLTPIGGADAENLVFNFAYPNMQVYPGVVARDFGRFTLEGLTEVKKVLLTANHIEKSEYDNLVGVN